MLMRFKNSLFQSFFNRNSSVSHVSRGRFERKCSSGEALLSWRSVAKESIIGIVMKNCTN